MSTVYFWVRGSRRTCPRDVWNRLIGPLPPEGMETDGCSWSPDWIADRPVWPACVVHDFHYSGAGVSRWRADWIFLRNLYRLLRINGFFFLSAFGVAAIYFWAVRTRASGAYAGSDL